MTDSASVPASDPFRFRIEEIRAGAVTLAPEEAAYLVEENMELRAWKDKVDPMIVPTSREALLEQENKRLRRDLDAAITNWILPALENLKRQGEELLAKSLIGGNG